jgi:methionine-rich copper-binding protein CopC
VYTGGSGTNTLTFTYSIQAGDSSADLGYAATDSLTGGTIVNGAGTAANRELPALGSRLSLNGSKAIVIQTVITASASVGSTVLSTNSGSPTAVTSAVRLITLTFNTDVTGVTLANLRFVKNGSPVAWGATTLTRVNGRTYRIALPTALTTGAGDYRLELGGASSPIASGIRTMTAAAAFSWRQS